jgi:integrase
MPYKRDDSPVWWVSFTDPSGKRIRRSTGTTDRKEAEALEAKWKLESYKSKQWDEQPTRSFEELMVCYLKATEGQKRSGETDRYRVRALRRYFQGCIMHELTPADIRGYISARRSESVTNSTINRDLALLSSAIGYANTEWDWRLPNPVSGRKLPEPEGRVRWITMDEADRLIAAAGKARRTQFLADFITVALYTGCRKEELLGLEWQRVDLKQGLIHLEARHTKAGKRRSVPLCREARTALLRRAGFRAEHCPDSPWVFARKDGTRGRDIREAFGTACRDAGIEDFTVHDLRHTCAAWLVSAGAPMPEIRDLLGHSTILMTERYAHLAPDNLRVTVARFDESRFGHAGEDGERAKSKGRT